MMILPATQEGLRTLELYPRKISSTHPKAAKTASANARIVQNFFRPEPTAPIVYSSTNSVDQFSLDQRRHRPRMCHPRNAARTPHPQVRTSSITH